MRMFEINDAILDCIDLETGEIIKPEELENLKLERHEKLRGIAFAYLQATLDAKQAEQLEKNYAAKKKTLRATAEHLKNFLASELNGAKMKEPEFTVSYRKSESVEVQDVKAVPDEYLIAQEPKVDKAGLKAALKKGGVINGVSLITKQNIQIRTPQAKSK